MDSLGTTTAGTVTGVVTGRAKSASVLDIAGLEASASRPCPVGYKTPESERTKLLISYRLCAASSGNTLPNTPEHDDIKRQLEINSEKGKFGKQTRYDYIIHKLY